MKKKTWTRHDIENNCNIPVPEPYRNKYVEMILKHQKAIQIRRGNQIHNYNKGRIQRTEDSASRYPETNAIYTHFTYHKTQHIEEINADFFYIQKEGGKNYRSYRKLTNGPYTKTNNTGKTWRK